MLKRTKLCTSLMIAFGSGIAVPAMAQQTFERVEITGSSIRRVDAETALPVTVIKVEDLTKQGVTSAEQADAADRREPVELRRQRSRSAPPPAARPRPTCAAWAARPAPTATRPWFSSTAGGSSTTRSTPPRST